MLGVPLMREGALLGVLALNRKHVEPFTEKQIALVASFADQAVIAMENARLLTEQREALEQQTATAEVLQVINASPGNLAPVFEAILDKAHKLCGAVVGSLLIYDGEHFHAEATHGQPEEVSGILSRPFRPNIFLQKLVSGEHLVHIPDFKAASVREDHELTRGTRDATGIRTSLWVPLRKDGVLLGCISAFRLEVRPFSEKEIALLENFAAQAVIAMENARLLDEQQEALQQQTAMADVLQGDQCLTRRTCSSVRCHRERAHPTVRRRGRRVVLLDGERFRAVALRGVPAAFAEFCPSTADGRPTVRCRPDACWCTMSFMSGTLPMREYPPASTPAARALVELGGGRALCRCTTCGKTVSSSV